MWSFTLCFSAVTFSMPKDTIRQEVTPTPGQLCEQVFSLTPEGSLPLSLVCGRHSPISFPGESRATAACGGHWVLSEEINLQGLGLVTARNCWRNYSNCEGVIPMGRSGLLPLVDS
jgi:hypothetical protein